MHPSEAFETNELSIKDERTALTFLRAIRVATWKAGSPMARKEMRPFLRRVENKLRRAIPCRPHPTLLRKRRTSSGPSIVGVPLTGHDGAEDAAPEPALGEDCEEALDLALAMGLPLIIIANLIAQRVMAPATRYRPLLAFSSARCLMASNRRLSASRA
jgi:hypothetical protein